MAKTLYIILLSIFCLYSTTQAIDILSSDDGYVNLADPDYPERIVFGDIIRIRSPEAGDLDPDYYFYGFVGWDFPANRTEWQVSSAILTLKFADDVLIASGETMTLGLCSPTTTWDSLTFSWNSMASFRTNYNVITLGTVPPLATGQMQFDVTNALNEWFPANAEPARLTMILHAGSYQETEFASRRSATLTGPTLSLTFGTPPPQAPAAPVSSPTAVQPVASPTIDAPTPLVTPSKAPNAGAPVVENVNTPQVPANGTIPADPLTVGLSVAFSVGGAGALFLGLFFGLKKLNKKKKAKAAAKADSPRPTDTIYEAVPLSTTLMAGSAPHSVANTQITSSQIKLDKEIGSGNYGKVYIAKFNNAKVAVKYYHQIEALQDFQHEADLFCKMKPHPNIVQLIGICTDGTQPAIVLEYCNGGSLDKYLKSNPLLSDEEKIKLMYGTACGICHLHINDIVHRDLAARNILLNRGQPKISDFGMSRFVTSNEKMGQTKTNIGPVKWMSPESIASQAYSPKSDVWMFANVCYEILTNKAPFENDDIFTAAIDIRDNGRHPVLPEGSDPRLVEILDKCWSKDANDRPSMDSVIEQFEQKFDFIGESESD